MEEHVKNNAEERGFISHSNYGWTLHKDKTVEIKIGRNNPSRQVFYFLDYHGD